MPPLLDWAQLNNQIQKREREQQSLKLEANKMLLHFNSQKIVGMEIHDFSELNPFSV